LFYDLLKKEAGKGKYYYTTRNPRQKRTFSAENLDEKLRFGLQMFF